MKSSRSSKVKDIGILGTALGTILATMIISILLILLKQSSSGSRKTLISMYNSESELPDPQPEHSSSHSTTLLSGLSQAAFQGATTSSVNSRKMERCTAASAVQICSHRGKGSVAASLLQAIQHLAREGVWCFDIDVFSTKEGILLAGRPSDLIGQLRSRNHSIIHVHEVTWKTLTYHSLEGSYPMLLDVLHAMKAAIDRHHSYGSPPPTLLLELKGRAMSRDSLAFIAQQGQIAGITRFLRIWATSESDEALLHEFKSDRVHLLSIRSVPDSKPTPDSGRVAIPDPLGDVLKPNQQLEFFSAFGPSINHNLTILSALKKTGRQLVVWVVDTDADLDKSLDIQANLIITNDPPWLKTAISSKCKER